MNKNTQAILFLIIGILVGYIFATKISSSGMHRMPNGEMMRNDGKHENMSMKQMMEQMNQALIGKKDAEFDKAFLEEMIPHHEGAIEMAKLVQTSTTRPELIKLANEIIIAQQKEIDQMRGWQRTWFGIEAY